MQLGQLRGKPVILNFWARLCPPCWSEMPELQEFYKEFEDQVVLLGIDIGQFTGLGSYRDASKLLKATGVTYPAGFTNDADIVRKYRVMLCLRRYSLVETDRSFESGPAHWT